MDHKKLVLASLLAASGFAAQSGYAQSNWVGTADYTAAPSSAADEDIVGPFNTYDAGSGVVLLKPNGVTGSTSHFNGYYQSFVTKHELDGSPVAAINLDSTYELTLVANFTEDVTNSGAITITGGSFGIYLDTTPDRDFDLDSGFTDGDLILSGVITGGNGAATNVGSMIFGASNIEITVTGYNANVFSPDTITNAGGIFTLRLNNPYDATFLDGISSVQSQAVGADGLKFAADGYIALAVPEAETYAMMLVGLGLVGFMVRRSRMSV